jgi:hypothetical protein
MGAIPSHILTGASGLGEVRGGKGMSCTAAEELATKVT